MKTKTFSLRLSEEEFKILEILTQKSNANSISDLVRKSITIYYEMFIESAEKKGDHVIFHERMLKILIEDSNEETIKKLAQESFNIGMEEDELDLALNPNIKNPNIPENFEHHLNMMAKYVFSERGQRWFEKSAYSKNGKALIFAGSHKFGINFSRFIKQLLGNFADYYHYEIIKATEETEKVVLRFEPKCKK